MKAKLKVMKRRLLIGLRSFENLVQEKLTNSESEQIFDDESY